MDKKSPCHRSILIDSYRDLIDFANKYFVLSAYFIRGDENIFYKIERMMLVILLISILLLFTLHMMPQWLALLFAILFAQRVLEFIVVKQYLSNDVI